MPKIKNIIIFIAIGTAFVLIYVFFIKTSPPSATLISSSPPSVAPNTSAPKTAVLDSNSLLARDFLTLLLSVKSIKLDDAIFSSNVFASLRDSSIVLIPDGNEGRPNPFAPFGIDDPAPTVNNPNTNTKAPATPPKAPATVTIPITP